MGSTNYIFANTGQTPKIVIQIVDGYGYPIDLDGYGNWMDGYGYKISDGYYSINPDGYYLGDGYYVPVITKIISPDLTINENQIGMKRLSTGLYYQGIPIPNGTPAIGTYIVNVSRMEFGKFVLETYSINATRPFGISSVTPV